MSNPCEIVEEYADGGEQTFTGLALLLNSVSSATEALVFALSLTLTTPAAFAEQTVDNRYFAVTDTAHATDSTHPKITGVNILSDAADGSEELFINHPVMVVESADFGETVSFEITSSLSSAAVAAEVVFPRAKVLRTVTDTGHGSDQIITGATVSITTETADGAETAFPSNHARGLLDNTADGSESVFLSGRARGFLEDAGGATESLFPHLHSIAILYDVAFADGYALLTDAGMGWTAPLDTFAMSRYEKYPFNSLSVVNGRLIGLTDEGAFQFSKVGDEQVDMLVDTGITDIGDPKLKRASHAYTGYASNGTLKVTATNIEQGVKQSFTYEMPTRVATDPVPGKTKLGRGAKSRYWGFVLQNVDGSDCTVYEHRVIVDTTSRKV